MWLTTAHKRPRCAFAEDDIEFPCENSIQVQTPRLYILFPKVPASKCIRSIPCRACALMLIVLCQALSVTIHPSYNHKLTSVTFSATFVYFPKVFKVYFNGQLLVRYHHLRTFAPTVLPLSRELRFQYRHPWRARDQIIPCKRGIKTWTARQRLISTAN